MIKNSFTKFRVYCKQCASEDIAIEYSIQATYNNEDAIIQVVTVAIFRCMNCGNEEYARGGESK